MTELIKKYSRRDAAGSLRYYGLFKCCRCLKEFERRLGRSNKQNRFCLPCANMEAGKKRITHGFNNSNSRLHVTWSNMKRRCINPTEKEKRNYGARVALCDEWHSFVPFMEWAMDNGYTDKGTIDRKNPDKGYFPENCRFVGYSTQSANRRITSKNTSGYIGVSKIGNGKWRSALYWRKKKIHIGSFAKKIDAAIARDRYIVKNGLPHTLNFGANHG